MNFVVTLQEEASQVMTVLARNSRDECSSFGVCHDSGFTDCLRAMVKLKFCVQINRRLSNEAVRSSQASVPGRCSNYVQAGEPA